MILTNKKFLNPNTPFNPRYGTDGNPSTPRPTPMPRPRTRHSQYHHTRQLVRKIWTQLNLIIN